MSENPIGERQTITAKDVDDKLLDQMFDIKRYVNDKKDTNTD